MTTDNPTRSRIIADIISGPLAIWFPDPDDGEREPIGRESQSQLLHGVATEAYQAGSDAAYPGGQCC